MECTSNTRQHPLRPLWQLLLMNWEVKRDSCTRLSPVCLINLSSSACLFLSQTLLLRFRWLISERETWRIINFSSEHISTVSPLLLISRLIWVCWGLGNDVAYRPLATGRARRMKMRVRVKKLKWLKRGSDRNEAMPINGNKVKRMLIRAFVLLTMYTVYKWNNGDGQSVSIRENTELSLTAGFTSVLNRWRRKSASSAFLRVSSWRSV